MALQATELLGEFLSAHENLFVLTGAGVSTASGLPDYRDESGNWKQQKPMEYQDFIHNVTARQRYWARSLVGWRRFAQAVPNPAHDALARLESSITVSALVTQNVDRLHQRAGSRKVIDLHGNLEQVICLGCARRAARAQFQQRLLQSNPHLAEANGQSLADGDALMENIELESITVPACETCGGVIKPDVVFFGENVPATRVSRCFEALADSDAMLVVGSSLMVYSGLRFVRQAHRQGLPVVAINRGRTRADELFEFKIEADCAEVLNQALTLVNPVLQDALAGGV